MVMLPVFLASYMYRSFPRSGELSVASYSNSFSTLHIKCKKQMYHVMIGRKYVKAFTIRNLFSSAFHRVFAPASIDNIKPYFWIVSPIYKPAGNTGEERKESFLRLWLCVGHIFQVYLLELFFGNAVLFIYFTTKCNNCLFIFSTLMLCGRSTRTFWNGLPWASIGESRPVSPFQKRTCQYEKTLFPEPGKFKLRRGSFSLQFLIFYLATYATVEKKELLVFLFYFLVVVTDILSCSVLIFFWFSSLFLIFTPCAPSLFPFRNYLVLYPPPPNLVHLFHTSQSSP
jgi:hypothetical protein